ncbi:SsrA-binding protein SmpB [Candidatus Dependentiae bacterium]|nr:SsrA-binding protein SmpB [Candidatus Dependentiae bacterium]
MKIIAKNKRAFHDYEIKETVEAGIVLTGDEVKSLRQGNVSLTDAFATVHNGEINLLNCYIAPYSHAYEKEDKSRRSRKLLLHRKQINKLIGDISRKGLTLIPLKLFFSKRGFVKVELGIAKHKKKVDKKRELRERDIKRETEREMKVRVK